MPEGTGPAFGAERSFPFGVLSLVAMWDAARERGYFFASYRFSGANILLQNVRLTLRHV
jgi:hypothetical protein